MRPPVLSGHNLKQFTLGSAYNQFNKKPNCNLHIYHPQRSWGKVIFLEVVSVHLCFCLFTGGGYSVVELPGGALKLHGFLCMVIFHGIIELH